MYAHDQIHVEIYLKSRWTRSERRVGNHVCLPLNKNNPIWNITTDIIHALHYALSYPPNEYDYKNELVQIFLIAFH